MHGHTFNPLGGPRLLSSRDSFHLLRTFKPFVFRSYDMQARNIKIIVVFGSTSKKCLYA